ncbi:MAG: metallophosphoesterase [Candidatus Micrarchaeia archaeon]
MNLYIHMNVEFVKEYPILYIKDISCLVIGDLHIGKEDLFKNRGVVFLNATKRMSQILEKEINEKKAEKLVLLGDIKESIMYPEKKEYLLLKEFFEVIKNKIKIYITKGNHDGHIEEIIDMMGIKAKIKNEILIKDYAFLHGNGLPSNKAILKKYIISAHAHAVDDNGKRIWITAPLGKGALELYKPVNKKCKLIIVPQFNELLTGLNINKVATFLPMLRKDIFSIKKAQYFYLNEKILKTKNNY